MCKNTNWCLTVVTQCFSFCPKHFDADIAEYEVSYCHDSTVVEYLDTEKNYHTNPIFEEKKRITILELLIKLWIWALHPNN